MMKFMMSFLLLCIAFGLMSFPVHAYMGPGAGLTAFGCLVALLAGIWYTFKGFLWLPLKRRFGKKTVQSEPVAQIDVKQNPSKAESVTEPNADKS